MNLAVALKLIELALGLANNATSGKANAAIADIQALEQMAAAVAKQYQELAGKPLDLSLLTFEDPIT